MACTLKTTHQEKRFTHFFRQFEFLEGPIRSPAPTNPSDSAEATGLTFRLAASYAENNSTCNKIGKVDVIVKLYRAERRFLE